MTTTTQSFLGIPIEGEITLGHEGKPQRPLSDLEPLIRAVLDDPLIHSFGWTQCTPYFNDGDPCYFSSGDPWFRTVHDVKPKAADSDDDWDDDDRDDDEFSILYGHPTLGKREYHYQPNPNGRGNTRVYDGYQGDHEQTYTNCLALAEAFDSDAFEDVLLQAFGDHAEVTVKRDGITVEHYEHD